jgi:hypothetical protein
MMGWACISDTADEKYIQKFGGETSWKAAVGRLRTQEDSIKMDLIQGCI